MGTLSVIAAIGSNAVSRVDVPIKLMENAVCASDLLARVRVLLEKRLLKALMDPSEVRF